MIWSMESLGIEIIRVYKFTKEFVKKKMDKREQENGWMQACYWKGNLFNRRGLNIFSQWKGVSTVDMYSQDFPGCKG